jgi:CBS domain-containing protein
MSLESNLQKELVVHLDLTNFTQVESGVSVRDSVAKMRTENNNCAIVTNAGKLIGIFTDRDLVKKVVEAPATWDKPIDEVMTPAPITVASTDPADAALDLMDKKHFRNVPVIDNSGVVIGNLTHHAIIKYLADHFPESVYNLPPDPERVARKRDGG